MKTLAFLKTTVVAVATLNLAVPMQWVFADPPTIPAKASSDAAPWTKASDVVLGERGRLSGQVLDANGKAQVGIAVQIEQDGKKIIETRTDKAGRFSVEDVRGGVCNIHVDGMVSTFRCWTADAAPPSAKPEVLVIADAQFARGQRPIREIMTNPLLIGAVLAAAIAIPIAIHNSQNRGPGS